MRPKHVARNPIITLDFDGCIALGEQAKIKYAKVYHNIDLNSNQIVKKTYPLGPEKYKELMDKVTTIHIMEYILDPKCKQVLKDLYNEGFRFAVVTSRSGEELKAAIKFSKFNKLPISYFHGTDNKPKTLICRKLKSRAMIDDSLHKLAKLVNTPLHLYFLKRKWNSHEIVSRRSEVIQIKGWREFQIKLLEMRELHEAICYYNNWRNNFARVKQISDFLKNNKPKALKMLKDYRKEK